jgi:gliding motility-associated-like protein
MLRFILLSFFLLTYIKVSTQQNLIPNPDFEEYYGCDYDYDHSLLQEIMPHWTSRVTTPHYHNDSCFNEAFEAYNGLGFIVSNLFVTSQTDSSFLQRREYPQVALLDSLYAGRNYYLEYYMRVLNELNGPCSNHAVYFSNTVVLDATNPQGFTYQPLILEPQLEIDTLFGTHTRWGKAWFCYTPDQNYSVATFGIFRPRDSIQTNSAVLNRYSYDAFYLIEVPDTLSLVSTPERDTICVGECVTLSSNHSRVPGTFWWDLPGSDLGFSTDSVVTVCYDQPGVYPVGLSAEHCHGTYSREWPGAVVVLPRPSVEGNTQSYQILSGESLPLEICDNSVDWAVSWSPHPGLSCLDCPDPVFSGSSSAQLTAAISVGGACPDTCYYQIEVVELARARAEVVAPTICLGECFQFANRSLNASGTIQFGPVGGPLETVAATTGTFTYCPPETGAYELMLVAGGALNVDTFILSGLTVDAYPFPLLVETDFATLVAQTITLPQAFEANNFAWELLSGELGLSCLNCPSPRVDPFISGQLQVVASNEACRDSLIFTIEVARQEPQLYLPNAFSPNFDGINDDFRAYGNYFTTESLEIYDRYGGLMHTTEGPQVRWDGFVGSELVNAGVYVYLLRYRDIYGVELTASGAVTVLP